MIVSTNISKSCIEKNHSTLYIPSTQVPLKDWTTIQDNAALSENYIRISETQAIPKSYVIKNLRQVGSILFNNPFSTDICLHIVDREGNSQEFWVHDFYFAQVSRVLWDLVRRAKSSPINDCDGATSSVTHVHLSVSFVESFSELLQWIYTRDDDVWLRSLNENNFEMAMENVALLRLSQDAYYVLARFYEDM